MVINQQHLVKLPMVNDRIIAPSRWYRLIPVAFITYSLAYLDRANFGFGLAGGMAEDLGISSSMSSLLGSLFFLGYFFFQVPGAHYASRKSARKLIFWSLLLWGVLAMATGMTRNLPVLIGIRFMLGVTESAVLPAMVLLLSRWFTRKERSRANTFLIFGNPVTILWMSIASGYLVHAVGWRWMFIWEGIPAVVWAIFWWKLVNDRPSEAKWLSENDQAALEEALTQEQAGIRPIRNYGVAFRSRAVIALCLIYALWSIGVYGFVIWLPSIIHAVPGMSMVRTGWLSAFPYLMAVMGMTVISFFSDRTLRRSIFVWPCLLTGSIAFYISYLVGANHFWLSFSLLSIAGMAMYAPYGPFFALITELLPTNVAGVSIALINSFGALGSFAGSYLVGYLNALTGGFGTSYLFMSGSILLSAIMIFLWVRDSHKSK
jgi:sugar phosphate permease